MTVFEWHEDPLFWEDGVPAWKGSKAPFVGRVRQEGETSFSWAAYIEDNKGTTLVDRGVTVTLEWAQQHAENAINWHARGN